MKRLAPELNVTLTGLNEQQQIEALKRGLLKVHDDLLLVLDNANDPDELKVFKETFRGFHWHVLVTSRCSGVFEGREYQVTHLPPPLAKDLFVSNYKENGYRISPVIQQLALKKHQATLWDDGKALVREITNLLAPEQDKDNITTKFPWLPISQPMVGIYGHSKDPLFSRFLNNRALVLEELGGEANLLEAKGLLQKALASDIANFGACSGAILIPSWNLVHICWQLEQYPEAVGIIKKIFPISEQHLPDTDTLKGRIKNAYNQIMGAQK